MSEPEQEVTAEPTPICLNCSEPVVLDYCPNCGQPGSTSRYTFTSLVREVYSQIRKLDLTTSFRTIRALLAGPGEFVRNYLGGKRVGFLNPIKFFFYSFVVQVTFGTLAYRLTNDHQFDSLIKLDYQMEFIGLASTVFWGMFWALLFRRSELNLVENIAAAIFFVAQANFLAVSVNLVTLPARFYLSGWAVYSAYGDLLTEVVYGFYFARQLFKEPYYLLIPKQITLTLLYIVVTVVVTVGEAFIALLTNL